MLRWRDEDVPVVDDRRLGVAKPGQCLEGVHRPGPDGLAGHVERKQADVEYKDITFLYSKPGLPAGRQGEYWFCEKDNPKNRFKLPEEVIGESGHFLKQNSDVGSVVFDEVVIGITLPIKLELKVTDAPPAIKGNTVQGGTKIVTLETGATVNAPMFINEGDIIRVNTTTGEYVERVEKA